MCLYPRLIKNRKYTANKKNGGNIPPLPLYEMPDGTKIKDERVMLVPVGCGKCMECTKQRTRNWQVRLLEEIRHDKSGIFVTLTFSDESIKELSEGINLEGYELDNEIAKKAVRRFLERWRKKHKKSVKHWLVTELGHNGTENLHLHGIIWTDKKADIKDIWKYGFTWEGNYVNERTVNYIVKYINKTDIQHKYYNPKILTSSGIGKKYTERVDSKNNKYNGEKTDERYTARQGYKTALPIYYRNKIYNEEEREKLWIDKINKKIRYVNGVKIDISENEEEYYKELERAREKNKRLGYGDNAKDWNKRRYEHERRLIMQKERIKKTNPSG